MLWLKHHLQRLHAKWQSCFTWFYKNQHSLIEERQAILLRQAGLTANSLIEKVENRILLEFCEKQNLNSYFVKLGGSNNLGFIEHRCDSNQQVFVTKVAYSHFINREKAFLKWHADKMVNEHAFTVLYIGSGVLCQTHQIKFITTKKLKPISNPTNKQLFNLFEKSASGVQYFAQHSEDIPFFQGGSRIRDTLLNLVCNPSIEKAENFLNQFFIERIDFMLKFNEQLNFCYQQMSKLLLELYSDIKIGDLGFVHGDFKASNMLQESDESLRLIDFQYYCFGFREWDLAFYWSKKKNGFIDVRQQCHSNIFDKKQKQRLLFFYVIACLLHPKPDKFIKIYKSQVLMAIQEYKKL